MRQNIPIDPAETGQAPEGLKASLQWRALSQCGCCGGDLSEPVGAMGGVAILRCTTCRARRFAQVVDSGSVYLDGYHTGTGSFGWNWASDDDQDHQAALADLQLAWIEQRVPRGSLLDIGGGLGHFAAAAARRGWDATLLDPVAEAVDYAKRVFTITAIQGTVDSLQPQRGRYSLVSLVHCLEHLPPALDVLRQVRELIEPGGYLYVEVPNFGSIPRRTLGPRWQGWQVGEHVYLFERAPLLSLLRRAGYDIVRQGSVAPVFEGLTPDTYAYFLGLSPILGTAMRLKRRLRPHQPRSSRGTENDTRSPTPIRDARGVRRLLFAQGFAACRRLEEATGMATNLRLLARPA